MEVKNNVTKKIDWILKRQGLLLDFAAIIFLLVLMVNSTNSIVGQGLGALVGAFALKVFNRIRKRRNLHAPQIFEKKLEVYHALFKKMIEVHEKGKKIINNETLSSEERKEKWGPIVLRLAEFLDKNKIFINAKIAMHCAMCLQDFEKYPDLSEEKQSEYDKNWGEIDNLLREELGIKRVEDYFDEVNEPNLDSSYIEYLEKLVKRTEDQE